MRKVILVLFCLILLFFLAGFLLFNGVIWFVYPDKNQYPVRGIDISHYQGDINWEKVQKENLDFVFMKATEGDDFVDHQFEKNWQGAKSSGLVRGAYHYYSLRFSGKIQAENFIKTVPDDPDMLPPVIDLEYGGNSQQRPGKEDLQRELNTYIEMITQVYKKQPILYVTYTFYQDYLAPEFNYYHIWIRDIYAQPKKEIMEKWTFWQYKNRGHIQGIKGFVDLNVFYGNEQQLKQMCKNLNAEYDKE
ncbi:MAG: glycoside hydrolase family 25 protein [Spirochaetes bacterium]|nr:glycoside hydrolase family 25 protein [Spirochaetota bacterium]